MASYLQGTMESQFHAAALGTISCSVSINPTSTRIVAVTLLRDAREPRAMPALDRSNDDRGESAHFVRFSQENGNAT